MRSLALLLIGGTAAAAPVTADLDGDGSVDRAEIDAAGALTITTKAGATTVAVGVKDARVEVAQVRTGTVLVVSGESEAVIVQRSGGGWRAGVRVPIGGVGLDADYGYAIDTSNGVVRYQTRAGYHRCDGKPAYLFAEAFDGTRFGRLSRIPTLVATATPITAHADPAASAAPVLYPARAASYEVGATDAGELAIPRELDDGKPDTVWREELVKSDGEGQFFTFEPRAASIKAAQVRIVPAGKGMNRPRRLAVVAAQGAWRIELPDADGAYVADLPAPVEGCVTVVIESTWGSPTGTTGIAELEVFAEGERGGGADAALAHVVAEDSAGAMTAAAALVRRGAAGVAAIDAELGRTTDASARSRLVRVLAQIHDPAAGPVLARVASEASDRDLLDVIAALGQQGQTQLLHEFAARPGFPMPARIAAARALGIAALGQPALITDLAGEGPRELRREVIEAMTSLGGKVLVQAAENQSAPAAAAGDVWRALTRRARTTPDERADALAAMTAALATATDYERRYRLVDGIATLGDAAALRALADQLAAMPAGPQTSAYKEVAAQALAATPRSDAFDLILALAGDADVGVRMAALSALAGAEAGPSGPWHGPQGADAIDRVMITMLGTDSWPEVRRRAALALGNRCDRPGPAAALGTAVGKDRDVGVRGDALVALVACRAPGVAELLAKTWDDGKAPIELRQQAVDLAVTLGDPALAQRLVTQFRRWHGGAMTSTEALALVQNAAYSLGRLRPPGAADALAEALDDSAFPEIVAAAATSLGLLGPACPASLRPKLKILAASEESQIATAAKRAYAQCGK
jgi:hypothetical protein